MPPVVAASVRLSESIIAYGAPTATEDAILGSVLIYPNPASALVTVALPPGMGGEVQLSVWDATGRNLCQRRILNAMAGHQEVINLSGYGKGLYLVKLNTARGSIVRKILKH
ncbi:MAG: T9SS type A sorting domain-containing protein [Cytophagales bacterium]|nr:T9SS type A sorting domain-containing protein [Cytophagales bacterium]